MRRQVRGCSRVGQAAEPHLGHGREALQDGLGRHDLLEPRRLLPEQHQQLRDLVALARERDLAVVVLLELGHRGARLTHRGGVAAAVARRRRRLRGQRVVVLVEERQRGQHLPDHVVGLRQRRLLLEDVGARLHQHLNQVLDRRAQPLDEGDERRVDGHLLVGALRLEVGLAQDEEVVGAQPLRRPGASHGMGRVRAEGGGLRKGASRGAWTSSEGGRARARIGGGAGARKRVRVRVEGGGSPHLRQLRQQQVGDELLERQHVAHHHLGRRVLPECARAEQPHQLYVVDESAARLVDVLLRLDHAKPLLLARVCRAPRR